MLPYFSLGFRHARARGLMEDPLLQAVNFGDTSELRALLAAAPDAAQQARYAGGSGSLLHEATAAGRADAVDALLEAGALTSALDEDGQTPLHHAASEGYFEIVKTLAPNPKCPELLVTDNFQMTPYHLACENGHEAVVTYLLTLLDEQPDAIEPKVSQLRRGSALFLAQQAGHDGVVEIINSHRSSVSEATEQGCSSSSGDGSSRDGSSGGGTDGSTASGGS